MLRRSLFLGFHSFPTVILLGKTGNGKSSLGNFLLDKTFFKVSSHSESETFESKIGINYYKGIGIIDTPGFNDSQGRDQQHYENIMRFIKNENITCSLLVFSFQETKLSSDVQELIKIYCNIFNFEFFNHVGLVFSRTFEKKKNKLRELKDIKIHDYRQQVKEIIENFFDRKLDNELPCFFVDSDLDDTDDDSLEEKEKIINWIKRSDKINLDNISIKNNYKIKYESRETKSDYDYWYEGNYKYTRHNYYERYNKTDINNNIIYGSWYRYDYSTSSYQYRSSCVIM